MSDSRHFTVMLGSGVEWTMHPEEQFRNVKGGGISYGEALNLAIDQKPFAFMGSEVKTPEHDWQEPEEAPIAVLCFPPFLSVAVHPPEDLCGPGTP